MKLNIGQYIKDTVKDLKSGDKVKLVCVCPGVLQDALGEFYDNWDTNGWEVDYWAETDEYEIYGTMYYGIATITKK